jgi:hypothetical protein
MKKIVRFTEYRINHVRNRRSGLGGHMVSGHQDYRMLARYVHLHRFEL